MDEMDEIVIANTYLVSVKNGILHIVINQDAVVDIDIAVEIIAARKNLQKSISMLTLLDTRKFASITKDAREYTSGKEVMGLDKAMAIVTSSLPQKILVNFFIKANKPPAPTQMFTCKDKALEWLETFR